MESAHWEPKWTETHIWFHSECLGFFDCSFHITCRAPMLAVQESKKTKTRTLWHSTQCLNYTKHNWNGGGWPGVKVKFTGGVWVSRTSSNRKLLSRQIRSYPTSHPSQTTPYVEQEWFLWGGNVLGSVRHNSMLVWSYPSHWYPLWEVQQALGQISGDQKNQRDKVSRQRSLRGLAMPLKRQKEAWTTRTFDSQGIGVFFSVQSQESN